MASSRALRAGSWGNPGQSKDLWGNGRNSQLAMITWGVIYNIIHWFAWPMGLTTCQPSVWCSKYYFFIKSCKLLCKNPFNLFFYFFIFFYKITEMKIRSFECLNSIRNYEKIILGTSDCRSLSCLSHRPSDPAYYIEYCRIFKVAPLPVWWM